MDFKKILNNNLYLTLGVSKKTEIGDIKKSYYGLSKKHHPDVSKIIGGDSVFKDISEAWSVLSDVDMKSEYDKKSKFGKDYNEVVEFFNIDLSFDHKSEDDKYEKFKKREVLNIIIRVNPDEFDGTLEFPRYVKCKTCQGSGKDTSSRISITNDKGEIKYFDGDDGCDTCEGTGKDHKGDKCGYCKGEGKIGIKPCKSCDGERRMLGKQKLNNIKLDGVETEIKSAGHLSYYDIGKSGSLFILTEDEET